MGPRLRRPEPDIPDRAVLARPHVDAVDEADAMRCRLHDQRCGADAVAEEAYALHQRAVGDAGCGKQDVLAGREILRTIDLLHVLDAHRFAPPLVLRRADDEPREDLSAETAHRCGGDDTLGRAADAHDSVGTTGEYGGCG